MAGDRITIKRLREMKAEGVKIVAMTAWDYFSGVLAGEAGTDIVLVGDSLAMTVQGAPDTLAVGLDEMIYHSKIVARACPSALVVTDMPFMSYQVNPEQALINCGRAVKEAGTRCVKLEGGEEMAGTVAKVTGAGIPVIGHIGLTPQSVHQLGGYSAQAKEVTEARRLLRDADALQKAGACAVILECVPAELAAYVGGKLDIPTIGIGAGAGCDGQIQVTADLLGMGQRVPKHARKYADVRRSAREALQEYAADVRKSGFPGAEQTIKAGPDLLDALKKQEI